MDDFQQQDNAYLKKRLELAVRENDLLRKENAAQRKELTDLRSTFTNIVTTNRVKTAGPNGTSVNNPLSERFQNETALRQILEMQRKRIDELEKENQTLKAKYEKILFQDSKQPLSKSLVNQHANESQELYELRQKNKELEQRIKDFTAQYAREIAILKQKLAQQDAEIILNRSTASMDATPMRGSQPQLEPLQQPQQFRILKQFSLSKK